MKSRLTIIVLLTCGFVAGWISSSYRSGEASVTSVAPLSGNPAAHQNPAPSGGRVDRRGHQTTPPRNVAAVMDDVVATDFLDMVGMVRSLGRLASLSDPEIREAWILLAGRKPENRHSECMLALYLWSRMREIQPDTELPVGWSFDDYPDALAAEQARQNMTRIETRLRAGEPVPDVVRRLYFQELIRRDPWSALDSWLEVSGPGDHFAEAAMFSSLLSDPASRERVLEKLRLWPAAGAMVGDLVLSIAQPWIVADPSAAKQWIEGVSDPALRKSLTAAVDVVAAARTPVQTWQESEPKSVSERAAIRSNSLRQLAYQDPDTGSRLVAAVSDPSERADLVRSFSGMLAAKDYNAWKSWRDDLPAGDFDQASAAGFNAWANEEPAAAGEWLNLRPAGNSRDLMASELVRVASSSHPEVAAQWIRSIDDPLMRQAAITVAITNIRPGDQAALRTIIGAAAEP